MNAVPLVRLDRSLPLPANPVVLDDAQRSVVAHRGGPLLVLAGPGTGKTTTLVEAMASHLAELPSSSILGLTFGRRAAADWRARVASRCQTGAVPEVLTFHSFAYSIVRALTPSEPFVPVPRIASADEQLAEIRELLREPVADHGWPADWAQAMGTIGFAKSLVDLINLRRTTGQPISVDADFARAADRFLLEYSDVLASRGVLDYVELIDRASQLLESPAGEGIRGKYRAVFVDEYQDTDPGAQRLLRSLVDVSTTLVVVGDPDQSIYSFRGADRAGILDFPAQFPTPGGTPQIALSRSRRFGPLIQRAAVRVLRDAALPGLDAATVRKHRNPECAGEGSVSIHVFDSEGAQAAHIGELLRQAHLTGEHLAWERMAVLVRNTDQLSALRRGLMLAGVPHEVTGDELPLAHEPAVQTMLLALELAGRLDRVSFEELETLLLGPLGAVDAVELRRFRRQVRERARELAGPDQLVPDSGSLVLELFRDLAELAVHEGPVADALRMIRAALEATARARPAGPHAALWALWNTTPWRSRLERESLQSGARARIADRELDVICELFEVAARRDEAAAGHEGIDVFRFDISTRELSGLRESASAGRQPGVRLLTAHRAKGLEWDLVIVAGMQEGSWPDLGHRGRLLGGLGVDAASAMAEERRLAFVAATRARRQLVLTAVASEDLRPSRFLSDIGGNEIAPSRVNGRPTRAGSLSGLVGQLRTLAENGSPALKRAVAMRLARLAVETGPDGSPLVPVADPDTWWGVRRLTSAAAPIRPVGPVGLSASQLEQFAECPLRWFLTHEAGGTVSRSLQMGFGSVIHAVAAAIVTGELPPDAAVIGNELDDWWPKLGFETPWEAAAERKVADKAVGALLAWHSGRTPVAAEAEFDVLLPVGDDQVRLKGSIDRLDIDEDGRTQITDFKTGSSVLTEAQTSDNLQLALYQYVVSEGALAAPAISAGASLVYLRKLRAGDVATIKSQPAIDSPAASGRGSRNGLEGELRATVAGIRAEDFPARPALETCRNCSVQITCPAVHAGREVGR